MQDRKLLCYFMLPAMMAVVTIAACAPRQPTGARDIPPSAMEEALSYKAPFGDTHTAPPEIVAAGKALYEGKGGVSSLPRDQRQRRRACCAYESSQSAKQFYELRFSERA